MRVPLLFVICALAVSIVGFYAQSAHACSCNATAVADMVRQTDVVTEAIVGPSRPEASGGLSSSVTVVQPLRGPTDGTTQRVFWVKPDGASCQTIDLRPGRWQLFLSWAPDGRLVVTRCDLHSVKLSDDQKARRKRRELMAHLVPVKTDVDAVATAALAVRRMLVASLVGKPGSDVAPAAPPGGAADLAPAERAIVTAQPDGSFVVRWLQNPPAGTAVDAEVRVSPDGVAHVVRASASFSPD